MPVLVRRLSLLLLILGAAPAWPDAELARRFEAASPAVVTIRTVERSPTPGRTVPLQCARHVVSVLPS